MASLSRLMGIAGLVLLVLLLIDFYAYQVVKAATLGLGSRWRQGLRWAYWVVSAGYLLVLAASLYFVFVSRTGGGNRWAQQLFGVWVLLYVPKLLLVAVLLAEDAYRLLRAAGLYVWQRLQPPAPADAPAELLVTRSQFLSRAALALAAIPFASIAYGITRGKYAYTVHRHVLHYPNLPDAFDGLRVVQISDIHSGSFDNRAAVTEGVALANAQNPDLILFTGDLVNNLATEFAPWVDVFARLQAPMGVYSVLGNHDYGDYVRWDDEAAKAANLRYLQQLQADAGFRLLNNAHTLLEKDGQRIALVGVENWGAGGFTKKGDLDAAVRGIPPAVDFRILMSHDPSHWRAQVLPHPDRFDLTLSGHTHGMQFGVEVPGIRFSPVQWRYPEWAGLYREGGQVLNVNRGFGFIGFPGRVGIWPEITVIELRKAQA